MKRKTLDIPVTLRREWFLIELAHLTKNMELKLQLVKWIFAPFLRDQVTVKGKGLQYDKYDDEYIIEN